MAKFSKNGEIIMPDYRDDAKKEADEIDKKIIEILSQKKNFRVEAGAGSGKTYSMMKAFQLKH